MSERSITGGPAAVREPPVMWRTSITDPDAGSDLVLRPIPERGVPTDQVEFSCK